MCIRDRLKQYTIPKHTPTWSPGLTNSHRPQPPSGIMFAVHRVCLRENLLFLAQLSESSCCSRKSNVNPIDYEKLNKDLDGRDYIATSRFSIADIILLVCLDFAIHYCALKPTESLTNIWRWHGFITSRKSVDEIS